MITFCIILRFTSVQPKTFPLLTFIHKFTGLLSNKRKNLYLRQKNSNKKKPSDEEKRANKKLFLMRVAKNNAKTNLVIDCEREKSLIVEKADRQKGKGQY